MKKLLFVLLVLVTASAMAQSTRWDSFTPRGLTNGTLWSGVKYTAALTDTSQSIATRDASKAFFDISAVVTVHDSGSVTLYYQPSYDGITFGSKQTIDSLSNNLNAGDTYVFQVPAKALASPYIRLVIYYSAFRLGYTNDSCWVRVVRRY